MASVCGDMTGKIQAGAAWAPGLLHFRGTGCVQFLQGQLSNDMRSLSNAGWLLAGLHNPQGRVLALLRLLAPAPDHVVALLPAELADTIATTLRRFESTLWTFRRLAMAYRHGGHRVKGR